MTKNELVLVGIIVSKLSDVKSYFELLHSRTQDEFLGQLGVGLVDQATIFDLREALNLLVDERISDGGVEIV